MTSLRKNFIYNASYRVLILFVPLIITPYLSRTLGAEGVGFYSYTNTVVGYFSLFAMLGIGTHGMRTIASCGNDNREDLSKTFIELYCAQLVAGIGAFGAYCVYTLVFSEEYRLAALLWLPQLLSALADVSWFLFGLEEFKLPSIRSNVFQIASLVLVFFFVKSAEDVYLYIVISSCIALLSQVCLWPYIFKHVRYVKPNGGQIGAHLKSNAMLFLPAVAISFYTMIDKVLLGSIAGMAETGYYTYSEKICAVVAAVVMAFGAVMLPRMASLISEGKDNEVKELLGVSMWGMAAASCGVCFGLLAITPELIPVFLGDAFLPCLIVFPIITLRIPFIAISNVLGNQYLLPMRKDRIYTMSVAVAAGLNVVINLLLIPVLGAVGAAIGAVCAEVIVAVFQVIVLRRELPLRSMLAPVPRFIFLATGMLLVVRGFALLANTALGVSVLGLSLEIIVGILAYGVLLVIYMRITGDLVGHKFIQAVIPAGAFGKAILRLCGSEK